MPQNTAHNALQMKQMNRLQVLRLVRRGPVARSELAHEIGLTRASMSFIVGSLIEEGVLIETGRRRSTMGRKPVLLELRPDYACAMGLTISRVGAEAGLIDLAGNLIYSCPVALDPVSRPRAILALKQALRSARELGASRGRLLGLGISTPGPVDAVAGTILAPPNFDLWHGAKLCEKLQDAAGGRAFLENNSQALTMAEKAYGAGSEFSSFVLLVVESGIGGGIVRGDERQAGWRGFGNEIGHTSINFTGPLCRCGLPGCVEVYASVPAVLRRARTVYPRIAYWQQLVDMACGGDGFCRQLLEEQAAALGTALVNVLNVGELDAVILTGDVLYRGEMLRAAIERFINRTAINRRLRQIPVRCSTLGEHAELRAAAGIAIEKFVHGGLKSRTPAPSLTAGS